MFKIESLAIQLADMLGATLHYAGVKEEKMPQAVEAYLNTLDEMFDRKIRHDIGYEEIIEVIEHLKQTRPQLFVQ